MTFSPFAPRSAFRLLSGLAIGVALSGCDLLGAFYTSNGARFDHETLLNTDFGVFGVFQRIPRQITDLERQAGARQAPSKRFVRIGADFYGCDGGPQTCRSVVAAYFRANPPINDPKPVLPEPEGGFAPPAYTPPREYERYTPPVDPVDEDS